MSWIQVVPQILTPLVALVVAIGTVVWGRQRIEALKEQLASKDVAMAAKDEQNKALREALGSKDVAVAAKDEQITTQREALGSKDVAMAAKDEQMKVLQMRIEHLEHTQPGEMLKQAEDLKRWADHLVGEASSKADRQIAELTKASTDELAKQAKVSEADREQLESELETARQQVEELETQIENTETAEQYFENQAADAAADAWDDP